MKPIPTPKYSGSISAQLRKDKAAAASPLALPYLEEQMPNGSLNLSSEANGQRLELWLTPEHCVDSMSGAVQHLSAELRLNGSVLRGCASYGGARSQ